MQQSESTMKTSTTTKKRFHVGLFVNHVMKFFASAEQKEHQKSKKRTLAVELSISIFDGPLFLSFSLHSAVDFCHVTGRPNNARGITDRLCSR